MQNLGLLIICILCGFLLRRTTKFDQRSAIVLNQLIIYFFIPILTLHHVPYIHFQFSLVWLSVTPFMVYLGSLIWVKALHKIWKLDRKSEGALIMSSGIGSTSFVGFPIFETLYGPEGLAYGLVLSLAGTIMVFNTFGVGTGIYYSGTSQDYQKFLKRLISFPPLIVFIFALIINFTGFLIPELVQNIIAKLAAPFSVLALLAIGMQIELKIDRRLLSQLCIGQGYKLLIAPLLIYLFMWQMLNQQDLVAKICILGAAIGSMNAVSIVAAQMGLNPRLASLMPAIGIPISIPFLLLIDYLLS